MAGLGTWLPRGPFSDLAEDRGELGLLPLLLMRPGGDRAQTKAPLLLLPDATAE